MSLPQGFHSASEAPESDHVKILLYGASGTGKTTIGCTAPDSVFALTELGRSARRIKAMMKTLKKEIVVAPITSKSDMDRFVDTMRSAPGTKTIVFDSISDFYRLVIDALCAKRSDPLPSKNDWQVIQNTVERLLRDITNLPHNVIVLAGQKEYMTKEMGEDVRRIVPGLSGDTMPMYIGKLFQAVGVTLRRIDPVTGAPAFLVCFAAEDRIVTKLDDGLRPIEVPNASVWFDSIKAAYEGGFHSYSFEATVNPALTAQATAAEVGLVVKKPARS